MASGRPDFHPTMLLEGKHDTQLIPVLVDENGQMYIVMTGQTINVDNLPSDYFKPGENVGAIEDNVTVDQSEKDRDIIGIEGATRRQIAVDAAGIILARLKGAYGAILKDIAVDSAGILLARMKGAYGEVLKDVAIDVSGNMIARIKGSDGTNLKDVLVDETGRMICLMLGTTGAELRTVLVDDVGRLLAVMKGDYGGLLKTIAVDSNGIMKANLSVQDLAYLKVRPNYGQGRVYDSGYVNVPDSTWTTLVSITGKGSTLSGYLRFLGAVSGMMSQFCITTDNVVVVQQTPQELYAFPMINDSDYPLSISSYDEVENYNVLRVGTNLTFESSLLIEACHTTGGTKQAHCLLYYALVP